MTCPHCTGKFGIVHLFAPNDKGKWFEISKDKSRMYCPLCGNEVISWVNYKIAVILFLISVWFFSLIDQEIVQTPWLIAAYWTLAAVIILLSSFVVVSPEYTENLLERFRNSMYLRLYIMASMFFISGMAVLLMFLYIDRIPTMEALKEVNGTVWKIRSYKDYQTGIKHPYLIYLLSDKEGRFYEIAHADKWPETLTLKQGDPVSLFVKESASVIEDIYMVWELRTNEKVLVSYEKMRTLEKARNRSEGYDLLKLLFWFFLFYLITLYLKWLDDKERKQPD